ncbi:hypothetical protein [Streptomyces sp. PTD5-9]|uniref:hypothetical protein n=1 Tax=Streptomyces sp. PTD5-9 TaxID=3120150 RepID=UPI00300A8E62
MCAAAAALIAVGSGIAVGVGGCLAGSGADEDGAASVSSRAMDLLGPSLPWPREGQTSIAVEGLGRLGSEGGRRPVPIASLMWAAEAGSGAKRRLVLGVVLGQRAGTTPEAGLQAALDRSGALIKAVREALPAVLDGRGEVRA